MDWISGYLVSALHRFDRIAPLHAGHAIIISLTGALFFELFPHETLKANSSAHIRVNDTATKFLSDVKFNLPFIPHRHDKK